MSSSAIDDRTEPDAAAATAPANRRLRNLYALLGLWAIVATLAAAVQSVLAYQLASTTEDLPSYAFYLPDSFLALAYSPVVLTIAVAGFAGVSFPRWFRYAAQVGYTFALVFVLWHLPSAWEQGAWSVLLAIATAACYGVLTVINVAERNSTFTPDTESGPFTGWRHQRRVLYAVMGLSAVACTIAAAVLSDEAYRLAIDPNVTLACNVNAALSCGEVAVSWQAQVFGFPNAFVGLASEPVVMTIALAGFAGVRFPRWFMYCAQVAYLLALIFAYWLFYQSYVNIGALCPWCLVITVFTTVTFFTLLHINIAEKNLFVSDRVQHGLEKFVRLGLDIIVPALILITLLLLILVKYGTQIF